MPKILVDNSKKRKKQIPYAKKTCPCCGSVSEVYEHEVKSISINEEDFEFECPCGYKLVLYKYFGGIKYDENYYLKCAKHFSKKVNTMLWDDLRHMIYGYYKEYINLNHTEMVVTPINITLKVFIDRFEHNNWGKCISKNKFYKEYIYNILELSCDIDECSIYSQALKDYIVNSMKKCRFYVEGDVDLKLELVDDSKLIAHFRNGDTYIDRSEINDMIIEKFDKLIQQEETKQSEQGNSMYGNRYFVKNHSMGKSVLFK